MMTIIPVNIKVDSSDVLAVTMSTTAISNKERHIEECSPLAAEQLYSYMFISHSHQSSSYGNHHLPRPWNIHSLLRPHLLVISVHPARVL